MSEPDDMTAGKWLVIFLRVLLILALLPIVACSIRMACAAEPRSVAFDYRNDPPLPDLAVLAEEGFDEVVLSPRAALAGGYAETYLGLQVRYWLQPFAWTYQDKPVRGIPWDAQLWSKLDEVGVVTYADGDTAVLSVDDIQGAVLLPFHLPEFTDWYIAVCKLLGRTLIDYGCPDLSWEPRLRLTPEQWAAWRIGWARVKRELSGEAVQCNRWVDGSDGIVLEKVGWSLTPLTRANEILREHPGPPSIVLAMGDSKIRRATAAMALLWDAGHNWGFASQSPNRITPEFHDLQIGEFYDSAWERAPGIWMRLSTTGGVLLNLSGSTYRWGPYSIPADDGFVFQRPSWLSGKATGHWESNQGR